MRASVRKIHFIGIGGSGMGGIAEVLVREGYQVSGSDIATTAMTEHLAKLGVQIQIGHQLDNLDGADVVVVSTAIAEDNVELVAARDKRLTVVRRAAMLAELMRFRYGIAIAGTHGKTTTTSLVASVLAAGDLDPTYVIGGRLNSSASHAHLGDSRYLVVEADESDASFLHLQPMMSIVTNIDEDHMATYQGDFSILRQTFKDFIHNLPFYGLAIVCVDDENVRDLLSEIERPLITYGFTKEANYHIADFRQEGLQSYFTLTRHGKDKLDLCLNMPGRHNVQNAVAAIAVASELGVSDDAIAKALHSFSGVGRRLQVLGNYEWQGKSITLIDDYGHHPKELQVTLTALKQAYPNRRVVMVFQPHRYSRTHDLFDDFCRELSFADGLILLEVYSAGETPIANVSSNDLAEQIQLSSGAKPIVVAEQSKLLAELEKQLRDGDVLLMQGAGNIGTLVKDIQQALAV